VQHRARLRVIDQQLALSRPHHEPGLQAVRREEGGQGGDFVRWAVELAVQLAGLPVPHLEGPSFIPTKQSATSQGGTTATADDLGSRRLTR
jgi:hypothetical protein